MALTDIQKHLVKERVTDILRESEEAGALFRAHAEDAVTLVVIKYLETHICSSSSYGENLEAMKKMEIAADHLKSAEDTLKQFAGTLQELYAILDVPK